MNKIDMFEKKYFNKKPLKKVSVRAGYVKGTLTWKRIIARIDKKLIELEREKKELLNCIEREKMG